MMIPIPVLPRLARRLVHTRESGVFLALLLLVMVLAVTRNRSFLNGTNLGSLGTQITFTAISGIGVLFVILTAGVDLSVGASAGLSSFVCAIVVFLLREHPWAGLAAGLAAAMLTGALVGAANGAVISFLGVTPFIVTLGMMGIARSTVYSLGRFVVARYLVPEGQRQETTMPVTGLPQQFVDVGSGNFLHVPVPVWILVLLAVAAHLVLAHTVYGRKLYAVGGNEEAARYAGIQTRRVKFMAYVTCSMICGVTGFLYVARYTSGNPEAGRNDELAAIAAAVIGGTSLMGGAGSVAGVILGACVMGVVSNGLDMYDIPPETKPGIIGAVIILAAIVDVLRSRPRT